MAKKSMVPFSAAVAADVLSAFHLPGGNTLQVGLQLCRDKACRDSRCPPPINPRAARPLTKTPRDSISCSLGSRKPNQRSVDSPLPTARFYTLRTVSASDGLDIVIQRFRDRSGRPY